MVKMPKLGQEFQEKLYLTESYGVEKIGYVADNQNYYVQKYFLKFNEAVVDRISNLYEIAPDFTLSQNHRFLKYN